MEAYRAGIRLNLDYDNEDERLKTHLHLARLRAYSKNGDIFRDTFKIHDFVRELSPGVIYDKAAAVNQDAHCLEGLPQIFSQLNWRQNQCEIQRRFIRSAGPEIY